MTNVKEPFFKEDWGTIDKQAIRRRIFEGQGLNPERARDALSDKPGLTDGTDTPIKRVETSSTKGVTPVGITGPNPDPKSKS